MHNIRSEINAFYKETASKSKGGGWRAVGNKIGKSGAYARQVALGKKPLTDEIAVAWMLSNGWGTTTPTHQRRPYWRPCLPVTLTPEQRAQVVDYAAQLAGQAGEGGE